ncbi:UDP-2,3-diacetamido-2,3-dideoxy-D-glucuronate 2-epimerase [Bacillus sp. THAF10]|nr:UDP-2,3-diacetamido-2,3-dideoxy-D-glucuronate 2-epimerase [Bacillus sp. THAF10]
MGVLITELKKRNSSHLYIHSGQHYDYHMEAIVSDIFQLPKPDYHLSVGSGSHATTTAKIMIELEQIFLKEKIDTVIVHGDTNTTLGACLAAAKVLIPVAHVEAGLRSYDKSMPEEINRILVDNMSTYLFTPTIIASNNLKKEGITNGIYYTGQSIVDAIEYIKNYKGLNVLETYKLAPKSYFFITIHRQENTDNHTRFTSIISAILELAEQKTFKLVISMHPRTKKILKEHNLYQTLLNNAYILVLDPPPNFYESIKLQSFAKLVMTDSGGLQEESCIIGTPCITLRENTERPETIQCGANLLSGYQKDKILNAVQTSILKQNNWTHPYGKNGVSGKILDIILN